MVLSWMTTGHEREPSLLEFLLLAAAVALELVVVWIVGGWAALVVAGVASFVLIIGMRRHR
jgi:hypothetical protein